MKTIALQTDLLENSFFLFAAYALVFIICVCITRAIFSIPEILKHQRIQTMLLAKIAHGSGEKALEIKAIFLKENLDIELVDK